MSGSTQCPHSDIDYHMHYTSMSDSNVGSLQITAACKICGKRLKLSRGLHMGAHSNVPTIAPDTDGLGILLPVIAEGEEATKEWGFTVQRKVIS